MTRDEAVNKIIDARYGPNALQNVDCQAEALARVREYVALGMLELDDQMPPGMIYKVRKFIVGIGAGHMTPAEFDGALKRCGLKIVEA